MSVENFFAKEAKSFARSILQSNAKKGFKNLFTRFQKKSPETISSEVKSRMGYDTVNYTVDKNQTPIFKSSAILFHEYLQNSPMTKNKIFKDEESGHMFFDGQPWSNTTKVNIINDFINRTQIKSGGALNSHLENALKLLDVSNYTGLLFEKHFAGWSLNNQSIIDNFLPNLYGEALETNPTYATMLFKKWITGAAKRAIEPGIMFDAALVLTGPAGVGKTSAFREILPAPFENRTGEIMGNIKNPQKLVEAVVGKTICSFDELASVENPRVKEVFKQLLSSRFIDVRLPWRKDAQRFLLRNVWGATTNKKVFIRDPSLSRRLWTIELNSKSRINFDYLKSVRQQLWQEATYLAQNNSSYLLTAEEQKTVEEYNQKFTIGK